MQVEGYVKCIQANFGGHALTIFGDIATLMFGQISLLDHGLIMGVKKRNWLKKFMQLEGYVKCMQANFDGHGLSGFEDSAPFTSYIYSNFLKKYKLCVPVNLMNITQVTHYKR